MVLAHHFYYFHGCRTGARSQASDLIGHHGKTTPMLSGTRRFNGRIECQQVGLIGDAANRLHNLADAVRLLADRIDALRCLVQVLGDGLDDLHRLLNHLRTFLRTCIVLHGSGMG